VPLTGRQDIPVNDNRDVVTASIAASATATAPSVRSELLCFIQNKSGIIPFDDLMKVCSNF